MKKFDHYEFARELISDMERQGLSDGAARLKSALDEGATGTEILMALRFSLAEIASNCPLPEQINAKANRLILEINKALA